MATWRHSAFAVAALAGGASRSTPTASGIRRASTSVVQGRVDPGAAAVGLEPDLEHQRRLALEPVLLHHAGVAGAWRTMPSRTAVYSPGLGSSRSHSVISCATFRRSIDSASARTRSGPCSA